MTISCFKKTTALAALIASAVSVNSAEPKVQNASGIYGSSVQYSQGEVSIEHGILGVYEYNLTFKNAKTKAIVTQVRARTAGGRFTVNLPPGTYIVVPHPGRNTNRAFIGVGTKMNDVYPRVRDPYWFKKQARVTVWKGFHTEVAIIFN